MPLDIRNFPSPSVATITAAAAAVSAAIFIFRRQPRFSFTSSSLSNCSIMEDRHPVTILVLFAKSPHEDQIARSTQAKRETLKLFDEDDGQEEIRVLLQSEIDSIDPPTFRAERYMDALDTNSFGRFLIWSPRLPSTHDVVSKNFCDFPVGTACISDVQYKGRGRSKNVWESPAGCLMFSFTLQMEDGRKVPLLQYIVSLAVTEAIKQSCQAKGLPQIDVRIKWPNDLYLNGLKVGGILCSSTYSSNKFKVSAGVGLNLDNDKPTTSLNATLQEMTAVSHQLAREDILAAFFNNFEKLFEAFLHQGFQVLEELYYRTWLHRNL
ncbi:biotin--protein ligase 1, chloroplastic-like isoform X2 [Phalaenopsis equestris]|uniref:biotin--protein ligase 1, chloroplastic-like isoform X2 n=1 Tax=Phalaenopsis equestris TaxID=78828 RepID=UPI0009E21ADA|nr:biotin--protein ligase 1, chloroplastic-like isoform X2 [Phalaenopsis equestris]